MYVLNGLFFYGEECHVFPGCEEVNYCLCLTDPIEKLMLRAVMLPVCLGGLQMDVQNTIFIVCVDQGL